MTDLWDGSYPPSVLHPEPPVVVPTGATAGTPGSWTPAGSAAPSTLAQANALGLSLGAVWAEGSYVLLADGATHIHWDGTAFAAGDAPVVEDPETGEGEGSPVASGKQRRRQARAELEQDAESP